MNRNLKTIPIIAFTILTTACGATKNKNITDTPFYSHATETLDSIYSHYGVDGSFLLLENFPDDQNYRATYLASDDSARHDGLRFSYLWPFSGTLSAVNAIYEASDDKTYIDLFDDRVLPGLEEYLDTLRSPAAYSSYITSSPVSDRFYDDNVWLGIDFTDMYAASGKKNISTRPV